MFVTGQLTCEAAGLGEEEGAPGHEEEEGRLQQWEAVKLGELGDVRFRSKSVNTGLRHQLANVNVAPPPQSDDLSCIVSLQYLLKTRTSLPLRQKFSASTFKTHLLILTTCFRTSPSGPKFV